MFWKIMQVFKPKVDSDADKLVRKTSTWEQFCSQLKLHNWWQLAFYTEDFFYIIENDNARNWRTDQTSKLTNKASLYNNITVTL